LFKLNNAQDTTNNRDILFIFNKLIIFNISSEEYGKPLFGNNVLTVKLH